MLACDTNSSYQIYWHSPTPTPISDAGRDTPRFERLHVSASPSVPAIPRINKPMKPDSGPQPATTKSYNDIFDAIQSFATESASREDGKLVLTGVKASTFEEIVEQLENHAEFNTLRFDFRKQQELLIICNPNIGHEIMGTLIASFTDSKPPDVRFAGTAYTRLSDGGKCPDFGIFSDNDNNLAKRFHPGDGKDHTVAFPTVVIEVGYSESKRDLAEACARWISCSTGRVRLAIGIDINYRFEKDEDGETVVGSRKLDDIYLYVWTMEVITKHPMLPADEELDVLKRADNIENGPSSSYYCFSYHDKVLYHFQSHNAIKCWVYPEDKSDPRQSYRIRRRHVYRSESTKPRETIFELKFNDLRTATKEMHELQVFADIAFQNRKRKGDNLEMDKKSRQRITQAIEAQLGGIPAD